MVPGWSKYPHMNGVTSKIGGSSVSRTKCVYENFNHHEILAKIGAVKDMSQNSSLNIPKCWKAGMETSPIQKTVVG